MEEQRGDYSRPLVVALPHLLATPSSMYLYFSYCFFKLYLCNCIIVIVFSYRVYYRALRAKPPLGSSLQFLRGKKVQLFVRRGS